MPLLRSVAGWSIVLASAVILLPGGLQGQRATPIRGEVVMEDGSPPPKPATIEQVCDDSFTAVGKTNKQGEYTLVSTLLENRCGLRAVLDTYESGVIGWPGPDMPKLVLHKSPTERVPPDAAGRWARVTQAAGGGRWVEAESELRAILAEHPDSAPVWCALGVALENQRKLGEARNTFDRAIENNPRFLKAYHFLAQFQMATDDWQGAARTAAAGIHADTDEIASVLYLDLAQIRQHTNTDGAEAAARRAIQLDKRHELPQAEYVLGTILETGRDNLGAVSHMHKYLELKPDAADAAAVRTRIAKLEGAIAGAATALTAAAAARQPDDPIPAGADVVKVPGGLAAAAAMAYLDHTPSRAAFFLEYCRGVLANIAAQSSGNVLGLTDSLPMYFATVTELSSMADAGGGVTLSLQLDSQREKTVHALALLGWKAKLEAGEYRIDLSDQAVDAWRQQIPSALGINQLAMVSSLRQRRTFQFAILSGQAPFIESREWAAYARSLPAGGFAELFARNPPFAKAYAGLAEMGQPTASAVIAAVGLRDLVQKHADVVWRYGRAIALAGERVDSPGGPGADSAWERLAGVGPRDAAPFLRALFEKDLGRLASFYFALWRGDAAQRRYFTESPARIEKFYKWYRASDASRSFDETPSVTWRRDLFRDLPLEASGEVRFPGGKAIWTGGSGADEDALLNSVPLETLIEVGKLESARGRPLDGGAAKLLHEHFGAWRPLFPYFEKLPGLGRDEFESLAAFERAALAQPRAAQNTILGEWHSLIKLIELGTAAGSLDAAAGARAFRRACEAFTAADYSAQALAALRDIAGGGADPDEAVTTNLLRLTAERRASFERVRRIQQSPTLAPGTAGSYAGTLAALSGTVYAALLDPDILLVSEDPLLPRKHQFVYDGPERGVFQSSRLTLGNGAAGSCFVGGFMKFEELSIGLARATSPSSAAAPASPAAAPAATRGDAAPGAPAATFRTKARLVEIYATVTDDRGMYVDGLKRADMTVLDEGKPVDVGTFEDLNEPISVALLLDATGSMGDSLLALKNAALKLIDDLRPIDSVAVYAFNNTVVEAQPFTMDKDAAKRAVLETRVYGATALHDALARVTLDISGRNGKKAIVVFTDGVDNASALSAENAIGRAKHAGVPVYAMALGNAMTDALQAISRATGGLSFPIKDANEMAAVFDRVSHELMHGYYLAFQPTAEEQHVWRQLTVVLRDSKGRKVRAREGYYPD